MAARQGHVYTTHEDPEGAFRDVVDLARRAPFYKQHLAGVSVRSLEDIREIPLTTKEHMRSQSPWGMVAVPREQLWHYHESTGTTGEPIACWYRQEEFAIMGDAVARWFPDLGPGKILLDRFPGFAPISFCMESALQQLGGCHIPCGNLSWDVPFPRALDFIRTLRPQVLSCLPLEMFLLWELADALDLDPATDLDSLETTILAGAPLPPSMRKMVERDWTTHVREIYGSNETLFLGASDPQTGLLHLETSLFLAEVLDAETKEPVDEGEPGVLTVTHLGPKAMPLVRYFTRDIVRIVPSNRPEPAIEQLGRLDEQAVIAGKSLFTTEILEAGYQLAEANDARIFFAIVRPQGVLFRIELENPKDGISPESIQRAEDFLGAPVETEAARRRDVLDPTALIRTPKVYKPAQVANWSVGTRRPLSIMEALIEWPSGDLSTGLNVAGRVMRGGLRRRKLLREMKS